MPFAERWFIDMTDREKELVNRYVYEVTKRIPKEQRSEIEMELR